MLISLLSSTVIVFMLLESLQTHLPLIKNTRTIAVLILGAILIYSLLSPKLRSKLILILSNSQILPLILYVDSSFLSLLFNPFPQDSRPHLYLLIGFVGYLIFTVIPKRIRGIVCIISIANLFVGILSLTVLILPLVGQTLNNLLFHPTIADYLRYNLLRGRIFPAGLLLLTATIPLGLVIDHKTKTPWRILALASFLVGVLGIIFSNYRSHIFTLGVGLVIFFYLNRRIVNYKKYVFGLLIVVIFGLFLSETLLKLNFLDRFSSSDTSDQTSIQTRIQYLQYGWQLFLDHPMFGVGLGNFGNFVPPLPNKFALNPYTSDPIWNAPRDLVLSGHPHNQWLLVLSETGLIGFIPYLILIFLFVKTDVQKLIKKQYDIYEQCLMLSSWLFLVGGSLDALPINALTSFFLIRGAILL